MTLKSILRYPGSRILNSIENFRGNYLTFHERPIFARQLGDRSRHATGENLPKTAIVIQGPLVHVNDFTLETIGFYIKSSRDSLIILSTWEQEDVAALENDLPENVLIVKNRLPPLPGHANINYQIASTVAGIQAARKLGADYVLKTRTDQRLYLNEPLLFLINLLRRFPLEKETTQNQRLISVSLNTMKYRLYGVTDMFMFGHIDDMSTYWNASFMDENPVYSRHENPWLLTPEAYLCTSYLEKLGRRLNWTLEDSWRALAEHFCIVDEKMIDLYWLKYRRHKEYRRSLYSSEIAKTHISFADWLLMVSDEATFQPATNERLD